MEDIQKALIETFQSETRELLTELETSLLELESTPGDRELVDRVFRALHTIKGNGGMFGFEGISRFTHDLETVYDLVREGTITIDRRIIDLTLAAKDVITEMMKDPEAEDSALHHTAQDLLTAFRELLPEGAGKGEQHEIRVHDSSSAMRTYRIRFKPEPEIFHSGTNPLLLIRELGTMGQMTVVPSLKELPGLRKLDPERSYLSWDIILTTSENVNTVRDVFIFVEDRCELRIDVIDEDVGLDSEEDHIRLGEILIERGDLSRDELEKVLSGRAPLGRELVERALVQDEVIESALVEQQVLREVRSRRRKEEAVSTVRVESEKLDGLVDLVGELVTVQARLSQTAVELENAELTAISEMIELLTWELRDNAFAIRMIPIGTTFSTFGRTVRDLASEMGREVQLSTQGGETELDKTVIEKLRDPLVHLIRNSIDHGIEPPDEREAAGKPRTGTIILSASQAGADVMIRVADDGSGMNEEAIRKKAVEKGLIAPDAQISRKDLFSLIFEPAFTTATEVTSVSGRGVGMDVVRRSVEALKGTVEVDSEEGVGTDIIVKLPLTLAIIEALQVDISGDRYIFPLSMVEECVELHKADSEAVKGRNLANVRGELIPYIGLRDWFNVNGEPPEIEQIVITRKDGDRVGFVVDYVVGEHQTVIKSLGKVYRNIEGISGATILGDGNVALILDVPKLVSIAEKAENGQNISSEARPIQAGAALPG